MHTRRAVKMSHTHLCYAFARRPSVVRRKLSPECIDSRQVPSTSASARRISGKRGEGGSSYNDVQHPRPLFKGNTSVADCICLYLAYSKLLKLTPASNAGVCVEKVAIPDEYLVLVSTTAGSSRVMNI